MLANDIALAGTSTTLTFKLRSVNTDGTVVRANESANLAEPATLTTSVKEIGKGSAAIKRLFGRLDVTQPAQADGTRPVCSVHFVANVPVNNDAAALTQDMVTRLKAFLTSGNITSMLAGAV